jgi:hypothetical protein
MRRQLGIHACWLDKECRGYGVPAFTYLHLWWLTIRINPLYTRGYGFERHVLQAWRTRPRDK